MKRISLLALGLVLAAGPSAVAQPVLPAITVLPYDIAVAQVFGRVQAALGARGRALADADAMIAATAIHHGLALVSGNLRHYQRVDGLTIERVLVESRIRGRTT